ncbi:MAG: tetraacyldisaccharide 4'-kinase [Saprospiraceae bacterium]|nr:tetraacyldisaccharide 4'-kinase [Saprospiraceae bacterium]
MIILRILLFPFAILFDLITRLRNFLFEVNFLKSTQFDMPIMVVGNIIAGGSGKTPHVQYIASLLLANGIEKLGLLSRGYGRKTKGYEEVEQNSSVLSVGDEPLQYKRRFEDRLKVSVCESRVEGIETMTGKGTRNFVLDDAFQHRSLQAGKYVLLTEYSRPFFKDYVLPTGLLRESRKAAQRADIIIVTKCPENVDADLFKKKIQYYNSDAFVCFSTYEYGRAELVSGETRDEYIVFSGIAQSKLFEQHVHDNYNIINSKRYKDHYNYTLEDVIDLVTFANAKNAGLLTTEKDYARLCNEPAFKDLLQSASLSYIPIEVKFMQGQKEFNTFVLNYFKGE